VLSVWWFLDALMVKYCMLGSVWSLLVAQENSYGTVYKQDVVTPRDALMAMK